MKKDVEIFNETLVNFNEILERKMTPASYLAHLTRASNTVRTSVIIVDYFRKKGYSDSEIFETVE